MELNEGKQIRIIHVSTVCSSCGCNGHVAIECPELKDANDFKMPVIPKEELEAIKKMKYELPNA